MLALSLVQYLDSLAFSFDARILFMDPAHDNSTLDLAGYNKESFFFFIGCIVRCSSFFVFFGVLFIVAIFFFLEDIPFPNFSVNHLGFDAFLFPSRPTEPALDMVGTEPDCFVVRWW